MARFEDLLTEIRHVAYGAPDGTLLNALRRAAQEACKRTQYWRETLDDVYARQGIAAYEFGVPHEAQVDRILWVRFDGTEVRYQHRPEDLERQEPATGAPRMFAQHGHRQELLLWPTPGPNEHNKVISVCATLSPTLRATEIPDSLVDDFSQGIVAQAKFDLLSNAPGMPWHNPQLGQLQRVIADEQLGRMKRAQHSGHGMLLTVQPRRFV